MKMTMNLTICLGSVSETEVFNLLQASEPALMVLLFEVLREDITNNTDHFFQYHFNSPIKITFIFPYKRSLLGLI